MLYIHTYGPLVAFGLSQSNDFSWKSINFKCFFVTFSAEMFIRRFHGNGHAYGWKECWLLCFGSPWPRLESFSKIGDYAWHNFLSGYRELLLTCYRIIRLWSTRSLLIYSSLCHSISKVIVSLCDCLIVLMLYVPVINRSVMSGRFSVSIGWTSIKQRTYHIDSAGDESRAS